ncbi:MAG: helix-hairpin-helix domain-containing protein, partial [Saprospiraceae bacterium]
MKTQFFNYLRFNRAERNGTFALFLLAFLFFAIPEIARLLRSEHDTDFGAFRQETLEFRKTLENTEKEPAFSLFYFDPNTASFEDFIRLGLNENVSNIICNYREKGGNFRQPDDFQKIWSLNKKDYARLLPYIRIGSPEKLTAGKEIEKPVAEPFAFDPNTASEADLLRLGLPSRSVKSILNYRNKGGQFRKKEDLEKIYTLGEEDYARIAPFVTLTAPAASAALPVVYAGGYKSPGKQNKVPGPVDINLANMEVWMTLPG